jgi:hypothetical protein
MCLKIISETLFILSACYYSHSLPFSVILQTLLFSTSLLCLSSLPFHLCHLQLKIVGLAVEVSPSSGQFSVSYTKMPVQVFSTKSFLGPDTFTGFYDNTYSELVFFLTSVQSGILVLACICSGPECCSLPHHTVMF